MVRRAEPLFVKRGVLCIRVDDPAWQEVLKGMVPSLAGRMAAACPELKIRKFRIVSTEGEPLGEKASPVAHIQVPDAGRSRPGDDGEDRPERPEIDLGKLADRYLRRSSAKRSDRT